MFDSLVVQFVVLWAVIDPIGSIPVYLAYPWKIAEKSHVKP